MIRAVSSLLPSFGGRSGSTAAATEPLVSAPPVHEGMPRYPQPTVPGCLRGLDYMGTVSFAISGAMCGASFGLDALGCTIVGTITALGGGTIRDIFWGNLPVFWLDETEYFYIAAATAFATFVFCCYMDPTSYWFDWLMWWSDTIGLGAFAVIGTMFGCRRNLSIPLTLLGTLMTCTGGGIVRDLFVGRPVRILNVYFETYAITTVLGGCTYLAARSMGLPLQARIISGALTTIFLRYLADAYGYRLPTATAMCPYPVMSLPPAPCQVPLNQRNPTL